MFVPKFEPKREMESFCLFVHIYETEKERKKCLCVFEKVLSQRQRDMRISIF